MNLLDAPNTYVPGNYGGWRLEYKKGKGFTTSYFSGLVRVPLKVPALYDKKGTLWMSITPMELESQFNHNEHAYGHVVVMGAGLGVLPFNLLQNPQVTQITVVEKSRELCKWWGSLTGVNRWPGAARLSLVNADARKWKGSCDTLLADIWPGIGDSALENDMETFRRNVQFKRMMCWGAELAFISWCMKERIPFGDVAQKHAQQWSKASGHYVWPGFYKDAGLAALTAISTL